MSLYTHVLPQSGGPHSILFSIHVCLVSPKLGDRELATLDIISSYLATLCEQLINTDLHLAV
jgi:hypothetical protein